MGNKHRKPKRQCNNQWIVPCDDMFRGGYWLYWQVTKKTYSRKWFESMAEARTGMEELIRKAS